MEAPSPWGLMSWVVAVGVWWVVLAGGVKGGVGGGRGLKVVWVGVVCRAVWVGRAIGRCPAAWVGGVSGQHQTTLL